MTHTSILKYHTKYGPQLTRGTVGSAGLDIYIHNDNLKLSRNQVTRVHTGLYLEIPKGQVGMIYPRSSLGTEGISLVNTTGVIDSDYRGEVIINLRYDPLNDREYFYLNVGDRIAQLVVIPCYTGKPQEMTGTHQLTETVRGGGGFGSTGS